MKPRTSLRAALEDPALLGNILAGDSWAAWRIILIAAMGEELTEEERAIFTKLTGREREPGQRIEEFAAVVGRRGGKSRSMATFAAYIGGLCKHNLVPGEQGIVLLIAPDQKQAKVTLDYCAAAFEQSPILRQLVINRTQDALELENGITIEVRSASFRRLRGPTYIAVIADEAAFWYSDEFLRQHRLRDSECSATGAGYDEWAADHRFIALCKAWRPMGNPQAALRTKRRQADPGGTGHVARFQSITSAIGRRSCP